MATRDKDREPKICVWCQRKLLPAAVDLTPAGYRCTDPHECEKIFFSLQAERPLYVDDSKYDDSEPDEDQPFDEP